MASLGVKGDDKEKEKWVRGTYYVRKLHPTLQFLMWDYGSLDEHQEKEYINAKMKMLNKQMPNPEVRQLNNNYCQLNVWQCLHVYMCVLTFVHVRTIDTHCTDMISSIEGTLSWLP